MKKMMNNGVSLFLLLTLFVYSLPLRVFAYEAAPVAITKQATFITEKSARLNGQANPGDMPDAYSWFEWGVSGRPDIVFETPHQSFRGKNVLIDRNANIVGLAPSTQYFFRQVAENGRGKNVGQTVYFTTKPLPNAVTPIAIVQTLAPSSIGDGNATLKGYISPHGDTRTKGWFQWGTTQNFENQTPPVSVSSNAAPFETRLNNLTPGSTYFFRAVAENASGRTYGATRIFLTTGTPPPPPEQPSNQFVPAAQTGSDGVNRDTTTSGAKNNNGTSGSSANNSGDSTNNLPGVSSENRPGDIFGALFRKKSASTNAGTSSNQVAAVAETSGPLGGFWGNLTGKRAVEVVVEKIGPKKVVAHTPVEYRISYIYNNSASATNAKLKIILPYDVVYIGDNTNNELLLEEGNGGDRTYVLPIGQLVKGSTRTISLLGITTGDAKGFPDVRARLEYDGSNGTQVVAAVNGKTNGSAGASTASAANSGGFLPSSFFGWLLYVSLIVLSIIGIRKAKVYYQKRKEVIESQETENDRSRLARLLPQSDGTPQGA